MCAIVEIMERELENTGLVYIYRENDNWYAYEQSAFYLSQMIKGQINLDRFIMDDTLWLARAEVDFDMIPREYIISYSANEYVLRYVPNNRFHDWLTDITQRKTV